MGLSQGLKDITVVQCRQYFPTNNSKQDKVHYFSS